MSRTWIIVLALWTGAATASEETDTSVVPDSVVASIQSYDPAKPLNKRPPTYPANALQRGQEAWINVSYCIDESGVPQNISILDSVGDEDFERAAIRAVRKWRFEPALVNGEPSWQSNNASYIMFAIDDGDIGGTRQFIRQFKKLVKLLDDKNLTEADALFDKLLASDRLNLYEQSKLWGQKARYEILAGNLLKADVALRRASVSGGQWLDDRSYIEILKLRTQVQLRIGQFAAANRSFRLLGEKAGVDSPEASEVRPYMERLWSLVDSDTVIETSAAIMGRNECFGCDDSFQFTPVRRQFSFADVQGQLRSIEMRCDHKRFESAIAELVQWHVPDDWGRCNIHVYGEPGTTFTILTLPDPES